MTSKQKEKMFSLLNELNIPSNVTGRVYIEEAVDMALKSGKCKITKEIFPVIAERHGTNEKAVERLMRYAIINADISDEVKKKYFGTTKLSCSIFIFSVAAILELEV